MLIRITDDARRPISGAVVTVASEVAELPEIGYVTDAAGEIEVPIPASGVYAFVVSAPEGGQQVRVHLEAGAPRQTVVLGGDSLRGQGPAARSSIEGPGRSRDHANERGSASAEEPDDVLGSEGWEGA